MPQTLLPGESYACTVIALVAGNAGDSVTNVVNAAGVDDDAKPVAAADDANVDIENEAPSASILKTASSAVVTYTVVVSNTSDAEALTLDSLIDDQFGDVTSVQGDVQSTTCSVPQTLAPGGTAGDTYSCTFQGLVDSSPHTNTVTGTVSDDDGSLPAAPTDSATVTLE